MKKDLYEELKQRKENGENLEWDKITKEDLKKLFKNNSDSMIAELYGVNISQVKYKRNKWNIKLYNYPIHDDKDFNNALLKNLNQSSKERLKERLFDKNNIDSISIALTHYFFRNGPVEDMHSAGKLSQEDMKTLNKFMVDRIAGILETMQNGEWLKLELLLNFYSLYGQEWDKATPDTDEINDIYLNRF